MNRVITLTTDFGTADGYVGAMKGVILRINPQATLVDITHEIAPQNVEEGAFLFAASACYFPAGAIHLVVVDPGVGTSRRPIAVQVGQTCFVAPDNGVLTHAVVDDLHGDTLLGLRVVHLDRPAYWLDAVSRTFHGRDIFAPVAAHLSLGVPLEALGTPIEDWVRLPPAGPVRHPDGTLTARVRHIDRFGNIVIDVDERMLAGLDRSNLQITAGGVKLHGLRAAYGEAEPGELLALVGSSGMLEVAACNASAAERLKIRIGDEVLIAP